MANFFSEAGGEAKRIPWWGWAIGAAAILLFGSHLLNRQTSSTGTQAADAAGLSSDGTVGDIGTAGPPPPASSSASSTPSSDATQGTATSPTGTTSTTSLATTSGQTSQTYRTYTVRSGDTLYAIASRYHVDEPALYSLNAGTIEATARAHNFGSSDHGHWIFPGEVLKIPA